MSFTRLSLVSPTPRDPVLPKKSSALPYLPHDNDYQVKFNKELKHLIVLVKDGGGWTGGGGGGGLAWGCCSKAKK